MSLELIERQALRVNEARARLREALDELTDELNAVKRRFRKRLESANAHAAAQVTTLYHQIESSPGCFEKPRTQVFHGIKVGYRKMIGGIDWDDDERVVQLIRKHLPDQAEVLIRVEETPIKAALKELPTGDLKRIGCQVTETSDVVVVKPVDSELDKMIDALLKEKVEEAAAEREVA